MDYLSDSIRGMCNHYYHNVVRAVKQRNKPLSFMLLRCRKPKCVNPLLDTLSCHTVLQLFTPEHLHVVPGLFTSVRIDTSRSAGIAKCTKQEFILWISNRERPGGCESHQLERDPRLFLTTLYRLSPSDSLASDSLSLALPTYVVMYSTIAAKIRPLLADIHFLEVRSF